MKVRFEIEGANDQVLLSETEFVAKIDKPLKQADSDNTKKLASMSKSPF